MSHSTSKSFHQSNSSRKVSKMSFTTIPLVFILLTLLVQKNQPNLIKLCEASPISSPPSTDIVAQATSSPPLVAAPGTNNIVTTSSDAQPRLPKINIYVNKHEIRKLLGINERINYVTNGNLNTYPLGFSIPLGYNQSDIIFTWQNLGQTNVNYSISLVIGNIDAVVTPSINITRSGQIPKQEQVFKITLPCSGKVTAEVDVQVLINIVGQVDESEQAGQEASASATGGQWQQELANMSSSSDPSVQSDQPAGANTRLVSHQLAIKRKKICTQHPVVMVIPHPGRPSQSAQQQQPRLFNQQQQAPVNRWPKPPTASTGGDAQTNLAHKPKYPQADAQQVSATADQSPAHSMAMPPPPDATDLLQHETGRARYEQQPATGNNPPEVGLARIKAAITEPPFRFYPNWQTPPVDQLLSNKIPNPPSPIPEDNPLNNFINRQQPTSQQQQQQSASSQSAIGGGFGSNGNNPLVLSLIALSLLISVALVVVVVLGSSHRNPIEKLNTLTSCLLRRAPASQANKCKSPMASAVLGSLRAGPKSSASSVSGLSAISGHSKSAYHAAGGASLAGLGTGSGAGYCYKNTNCATGYYASSNQYQQHHHHYQQPPTADLLGTGYQCQAPASALAPPLPPAQYPIAHLATGNTSHTTRLVWNNGNGTSPDGFIIDQSGSYLTHSQAPISDNGSAYQTIY